MHKKYFDRCTKITLLFPQARELGTYSETDSDIMDELGKDYFVAKPVEIIDLMDRLKVMVSQK
jgi:hypothetical protein